MSKTKSKKILELFYELGEKMDVKIVNAKGDFQGGYCQVNDKRHIVINKIKPLDDNNSRILLPIPLVAPVINIVFIFFDIRLDIYCI